VIESRWSGISSGTEKLFWKGRMPSFPGMGYPLVPGYETVGVVVDAGAAASARAGELVFVPGASCWTDARALFGGTASCLVTPSARVSKLPSGMGAEAVLLALAATAYHALAGGPTPELIVGHGILGRLLARLSVARGGSTPTVWETNAARRVESDYPVCDPVADDRRDYRSIVDASGDPTILDVLVGRLARGGEIALAGFYESPLSFAFPPAFMREARIRVAAEFTPADLAAVLSLIANGSLSLDGLVSHVRPACQAATAYPAAFDDPDCLKMVLDWKDAA
jgi:3-hydroxyethyl bacteriochlorophyllide a dehydrogenase